VNQLVLASRNPGKVVELRRILEASGIYVDLLGMEDFPEVPDVRETGATFMENALLKARAVYEATGLVSVADDSGLTVEALNGMPGILSARWAGRHGDDKANLDLVLAQLADVAEARRGAAFVCAAAAVGRSDHVFAEGSIEGRLLREPRGSNGFGYDPIFVPTGYDRTTAEMSADEKDAISHRGEAFRALASQLITLLDAP